ncbi:GntR family transcriptional regulator [Scatolibacter rhodanostii]|uniref:GntR family transcriptional regulator n=1 Tax=Scatolibacter rhodanostii TaxID=2014781 RepID=UPI000C08C2BF|nr:GntR family transcriptional regulator [Scatolibacter rhodanostii]
MIDTQINSEEAAPPQNTMDKHLPIVHTSIADIVSDRLKTFVMEGLFLPGQKLTETELCEQMGVSRTTIRKAFSLLEAEGFLERIPGSGMMVPSLPETERNIFREVLDSLFYAAQRMAKGRIPAESAQEIEESANQIFLIWDELEQRELDVEELYHLQELDFKFHKQILQAAQNPLLLECAELVMEKPGALECYQHEDAETRREHRKNHESILLSLGINE